MSTNAGTLWTLDELGRKVAEALAVDYEGPPNDRVRDVPDPRTIRYYGTLGLVDRPAEMRGRTAYYGWRHLMQLAAIKRLQARGLSLAEVQRQLLGISESALAELARLPRGLASETNSSERASQSMASSRGPAFWKEAPAAPPEPPAHEREPVPALPMQGIRLADGATLLIETARPIVEDDVDAIRKAAAPLLRLLERRGLIAQRPGKGNHDSATATLDRGREPEQNRRR